MNLRNSLFPPTELRNMGGIEPSFNGAMPLIPENPFNKTYHFFRRFEIILKTTVHITKTAIGCAFGAILLCAALPRILVHRHAAALAKLIEPAHNFLFLTIIF